MLLSFSKCKIYTFETCHNLREEFSRPFHSPKLIKSSTFLKNSPTKSPRINNIYKIFTRYPIIQNIQRIYKIYLLYLTISIPPHLRMEILNAQLAKEAVKLTFAQGLGEDIG